MLGFLNTPHPHKQGLWRCFRQAQLPKKDKMSKRTTEEQRNSSDKSATPTEKEGSDMTPAQRKEFEEWKAFVSSIKLSKSDAEIMNMATNAIVDAISCKAYNSLMILFNTYQRIYKFREVGSIKIENWELTETSKAKTKVGEFSMRINNEKCKMLFKLFGADIEVIYNQKCKFL